MNFTDAKMAANESEKMSPEGKKKKKECFQNSKLCQGTF